MHGLLGRCWCSAGGSCRGRSSAAPGVEGGRGSAGFCPKPLCLSPSLPKPLLLSSSLDEDLHSCRSPLRWVTTSSFLRVAAPQAGLMGFSGNRFAGGREQQVPQVPTRATVPSQPCPGGLRSGRRRAGSWGSPPHPPGAGSCLSPSSLGPTTCALWEPPLPFPSDHRRGTPQLVHSLDPCLFLHE